MKSKNVMIIFLDIDGVIATKESYDKCDDRLDRECIAALNTLTERTNAKIVISSSWKYEGLESLRQKLYDAGVNADIIDVTPNSQQRGHEILSWIRDNNYKGDYLVLDDEIFDIKPYVNKTNIIHIKDGFKNGGLKLEHLEGIK